MPSHAAFREILDEKLAGHACAWSHQAPRQAWRTAAPVFLFAAAAPLFEGGVARAAAGVAYASPQNTARGPRLSRPSRHLTSSQRAALDCLRGFGPDLLDESFGEADLRSAFRTLARRFHPDRHPGADEAERAYLARAFGRIAQAYRELTAATGN